VASPSWNQLPTGWLVQRSWVFPAVQGANAVDGAEALAVRLVLEEGAFVRQLAARTAIRALTFSPLRDGQHCGKGPFNLGGPGIFRLISHKPSFPALRFPSVYFTNLCPRFKVYFCAFE